MTFHDDLSDPNPPSTNHELAAPANADFDFVLVNPDAPPEYAGVGSAMKRQGREIAESNPTYKTARKLEALFGSITPHVPKLIAAYGKRVTEIIESPSVNPCATEGHGPFASFVGADATSIWAAAQCGHSAIAAHLLASLLVRVFDPAQATSVWVELIHERRKELEGNPAETEVTLEEISRDELRLWDASARAWLQSADVAMLKQDRRFQFHFQNTNLPMKEAGSLYRNVIDAWTESMAGVERLLSGKHQNAADGAILLALSSWHLYPDLIITGEKETKVQFNDYLFHFEDISTVGLTIPKNGPDGLGKICWPLTLSHYHRSDEPVKVFGEASSRLKIDELHLVALGGLFKSWGIEYDNIAPAANWLWRLWKCIESSRRKESGRYWLEILASASRKLLESTGKEREIYDALINLGYRRGETLLSRLSGKPCMPWFGLRSQHILGALSRSTYTECGIWYLRGIAEVANFRCEEAIISVISAEKVNKEQLYATAAPHDVVVFVKTEAPSQDDVPELEFDEASKTRDQAQQGSVEDSQAQLSREERRAARKGKGRAERPKYQTTPCHGRWSWSLKLNGRLQNLRADPNAVEGESFCRLDTAGAIFTGSSGLYPDFICNTSQLELRHAPLIYSCQSANLACKYPCRCISQGHPNAIFGRYIHSGQDTFKLWMKAAPSDAVVQNIRGLQDGSRDNLVGLSAATRLLEKRKLNGKLLCQYLDGVDPFETDSHAKCVFKLMGTERGLCETTIEALKNLATATDIYANLEGATISSTILETGLLDAKWGLKGDLAFITRSVAFSCITMLETGHINVEPQEFDRAMALSSGNSLFVSSRLLCDPTRHVPDSSVTRITGSIGRPGLSILIPRSEPPRVRSPSSSAVACPTFDGEKKNSFEGTSLQISLLKPETVLEYGASSILDHGAFLVEAVVSVRDKSEWVADLDILKLFDENHLNIIKANRMACRRNHPKSSVNTGDGLDHGLVSVESWEHILDLSPKAAVVRTCGNWMARLATAGVLTQNQITRKHEKEDAENGADSCNQQQDKGFFLLEESENICWICVLKRLIRGIPKEGERINLKLIH